MAARVAKGNPTFKKHLASGDLEYVFTSGGTDFFRFKNEQRIPAVRAFKAQDVYQELEYRVERDYLVALFKAIKVSINKGDLAEIITLVNAAEQRIEYISDFTLLYKLAAILYVQADEDPLDFDDETTARKVDLWLKEKDVRAFFLRTPLLEFLPFSNLSPESLSNFIQLQRSANEKQYSALSRILSDQPGDDESLSFLKSRVRTLHNIKN